MITDLPGGKSRGFADPNFASKKVLGRADPRRFVVWWIGQQRNWLGTVTRLFKKASAASPPLYQTLVAFVNYSPYKLLTSSRFMLRPNLADPPWERPAVAAGRPHHAPD